MGSVAVIVTQRGYLVNKVPTVEVVLVTIGIVVGILGTVCLALVGPYIVGQVGVCDIDTGIYDCNDRTLVGNLLLCPKMVEVYCLKIPLLLEKGLFLIGFLVIIAVGRGCREGVYQVVWLGKLHFGKFFQCVDCIVHSNITFGVQLQAIEL